MLSSTTLLPRLRGLSRFPIPHPGLRLVAVLLLLLLVMPVFSVFAGALFAGDDTTAAMLAVDTIFYRLGQTAWYVGWVLLLALVFAVPTAWMVVMLNFPGRRFASWLLLFPFALPPYITAFTYDEFQRDMGWYLPGGVVAVVATALAVYPYVYLLTRMALQQQHCHIQSAARLLGCSSLAAFFRVSLPLARPAIFVGLTLAAMETFNDVAIAEYFGLQTLSLGVYDVWLHRNNVAGGAQLALILLAIVLALIWVEEHARRRQARYVIACDKCYDCERLRRIGARGTVFVWGALLLPVLTGFFLPVGYLLMLAFGAYRQDWWGPLVSGFTGSMLLSLLLMGLLCCIGLLLVLEKRVNRRGVVMRWLMRIARSVYALPGTVIAIGVFLFGAAVHALTGWYLLGIGGIFILLFACSSRFFMLAGGTLESGMDKIPPQLDAAARLAGESLLGGFWRVHLPLLRPALLTAAIMIFLEQIKELPMTLILRPFNFDTLALIAYQYASDEALELAAPSALLLALFALGGVTVLFLLEEKRAAETAPAPAAAAPALQ